MSIYKGTTKVCGTGVQLDNTLNADSNNAVTNATITNALEDVGYSTWQKPADWIDIRLGALDNSIYALVGHKADYSKYNLLPIKVNVSNSGTYDIYIDGIKKYSAVASATETLINWQTLNLASGFDVTHPEELRTHIIRITPTVSTNTLTSPKLVSSSISSQAEGIGVLWLHFCLDYALIMNEMCRSSSITAKILEAVTSENGVIKSIWGDGAFYSASSLETFPLLEITGGNASQSNMFSYTNIKRLRIKLDAPLGNTKSNYNAHMPQCREIINESKYPSHIETFFDCPKLKRILGPFSRTFPETISNFFGGNTSMEDMFLDFAEGVNLKRIVIGGTSAIRLPWFKALTVSTEAPFDGASPQINVSYTGMDRSALVNLFNSMPTVSANQVCNITGTTGAADLTAADLAIATNKGWTVTR